MSQLKLNWFQNSEQISTITGQADQDVQNDSMRINLKFECYNVCAESSISYTHADTDSA